MSVYLTNNFEEIRNFNNKLDKLFIIKRKRPESSNIFFKKLIKTSFTVIGEITKENALENIRSILECEISQELLNDPFYEDWINDMALISIEFCDLQKRDTINIWIGTNRGCRRYHIDNVPQRLLVTYAGKGTEWLPEEAADRNAYEKGEPNEKIIKNISAKQFIKEWDIAIFRGGPGGLLHRTPDKALEGQSILMRLDNMFS